MLFDSKKNQCILEVLRILNRRPSIYNDLFRKIGVSQITLQTALKELIAKELIIKQTNKGYERYYWITDRGKLFLKKVKALDSI